MLKIVGWDAHMGCTQAGMHACQQISKKRDHRDFGVLCFSVLCVWGSFKHFVSDGVLS